MASANAAIVPSGRTSEAVGMVLDSRDLRDLVSGLEERRATRRGRPGYGTKALLGMWIVKALYRQTTWAETARLVDDHPGLRRLLGSSPSRFACYRFAAKLLRHRDLLERCIRSVVAALRDLVPGYGMNVAIDSTDLSAYANGQKYTYSGGPEREAFSDPDASWGHRSAVSTRRGGGFYGYKLHMATCAATDLPVAWTVETAKASDMSQVDGLLDRLPRRPEAAIMDAGYDYQTVIDSCWRHGIDPVIATRRNSGTRGGTPPDNKALYRLRSAVEREFGRLKTHLGLAPLRVRGIDRVRLHADLVLLTRLTAALDRPQA